MKRVLLPVLAALSFSLLFVNSLLAQPQLALSSGSAPASSAVLLNLTLSSPAGSEPAGIQWTFNYPASSVANFAVTAGPALTAAAKTLTCAGSLSGYICLGTGLNTNVIANGIVATVSITLAANAGSAAVGMSGALGASPAGGQLTTTATGGTVGTIVTSMLKGISCTPLSLSPGAVAVCTVTVSSPVAANTTVGLTSTGSITVPATVSIASNSASTTFNATAGAFLTDQTATTTATLNGVTATANLSLVAPTTLTSLQCASTSLAASSNTTCTVTLSRAVSANSTVTLSSSATSAVTVPASVTVTSGNTTAAFTATAAAITTDQTTTLTASFNGASKTATLIATALPITLNSLQCASTSLAASSNTTCTVTLSRAASANSTVTLSSSATSAVTVPASVTVTAGNTTATFTATAAAITSGQTSTITATFSGASKTSTLTVTALPITLTSLQCASTNLAAFSTTTCTVTLSRTASASSTVTLLSSSSPYSDVSEPASVTVTAGNTTATFTVTVGAITLDQTWTITASFNGASKTSTLTATAPVTISSLVCANTSLMSSSSTTCTVTISKPAPAGGILVTLTANPVGLLTLAGSATVPTGATTAKFSLTTGAIASNQAVSVTASLAGAGQTVLISMVAPAPGATSLTCSASMLTPNTSTVCTVQLDRAAPAGGTLISVTSDAPTVLTVPASVTAPAGSSSVNFPISAGAMSAGQNSTVRAQVGQTVVSFPIVLSSSPPSLSLLACLPVSPAPGTGGTCTVTLTSAAGSAAVVALTSTNPGLSVPASVTIPAGSMSAKFGFTLSPTITWLAMLSAQFGTVTKSVQIQPAAPAPTISSSLQLHCDQRQITVGRTAVCEILNNHSDGSSAVEFAVTSSSKHVKTPASVRGRTGRSALRFEVSADEEGPQESVTIEARSDSGSARESLLVVAPGSIHLQVPKNLTVTPESPVRFTASAMDDQGLPVSVAVTGKPKDATFDPASGLFEWVPAEHDLGSNQISLTAANSLGFTQTKMVNIQVVSSRPMLAGLRNGVGSGATAACTPGTLATLTGTSLAGLGSANMIRVFVNGSSASVIHASSEQVDFLCPQLAPETPLAITVQAGDLVSNEVRTVMQKTAPGLFSVDGLASNRLAADGMAVDGPAGGMGLIVHARGLAALPRFDRDGMPASAGDAITLFATGINCADSSRDIQPQLYFGQNLQPITLLQFSSFAGVCEIHAIVPAGLPGNEVVLMLDSAREDGTVVRSNPIVMAIEN